MLAGEYAREALKNGLVLEQKFGTNPFKFGMVGATDSHTGLATAQEDNFFGKHSGYEPDPNRMNHLFMQSDVGTMMSWGQVASGLGAVWAEENTREAIFDAMQRKEVYATTGSRMRVRFFVSVMGSSTSRSRKATTRRPGATTCATCSSACSAFATPGPASRRGSGWVPMRGTHHSSHKVGDRKQTSEVHSIHAERDSP